MRACSAGNSSSQSGSSRCSASRTSASSMSPIDWRAARHVPTMISGERSRPRSWSTTALSISAAGTRRTVASLGITLEHVGRDVVAVELAALARVRRRHRTAGRAEDQALEQGRRLRPSMRGPLSRALAEDRMHPIPEGAIDDGLVLARIGGALVHGLTYVDSVVQQLVEVALVDQLAAACR